METKPPTRTLPKLVMKEWPEPNVRIIYADGTSKLGWSVDTKALSDFTRVVEETGILDQERSQKDGSRDE